MQKRGYLVTASIAKGILVLVILGLTFKIVVDLTGNPVRYLLGLGNVSKLDQDIVERYEMTKGLNQDAISSINGLLYAINSLAVLNYEASKYNQKVIRTEIQKLFQKDDLEEYRFEKNNVKVEPAYFDRRTLHLSGDKEKMLFDLTKATLDCWGIFGDKANANTMCFLVKVNRKISNDDLTFIEEFPKYIREFKRCDDICIDAPKKDVCISKCKSTIKNIHGGSWISWWNLKNYDYDLKTAEELKKNNYEFRICGSNKDKNEIHFSFEENYCKAAKKDFAFGYIVENFALPQEIQKSSTPLIHGIEDWLSAYGDPEYIMFYEKFPKEEAEYWRAGAYNVAFLAILGTEAVFLAIDGITLGLGRYVFKPLKAVLGRTVIGRGARAVKGAIKSIGKTTLRGIGRALKWVFSRPAKWFIRQGVMKETIEKTSRGLLEKTVKKMIGETDDEIVTGLMNRMKSSLDDILERGVKEGLTDSTGKLTKKGQQEFYEKLAKEVFKESKEENPAMQELIRRRARMLQEASGEQWSITFWNQARKEVKEEISEKAIKEISEGVAQASLKTISRTTVMSYKGASRGKNLLKEIFLGDMTDKKRMQVLMAAMDDWEKPFKAMKPHELRTFIANQKQAAEMLEKMMAGEIGDAVDKAAAKALSDNMDDVLGKMVEKKGLELGKTWEKRMVKVIGEKGGKTYGEILQEMYPTSIQIQKFSTPVTRWGTNKLKKPRHLVALMAGYYATKIESMSAKFNSVGTNAIGLKIPYSPNIPYDDEFTKSITSTSKAKDWLTKYGSNEKYTGLLPVVNEYYLSLTKDQFSWWWDQDPQRFHLVSPCYADIILKVGNCDCKGTEDGEAGMYETGKQYDIYGEDENGNRVFTGQTTNVAHFDGDDKTLYRLDENGEPIKECYAGKWYRWDDPYPTKCIKINPIMDPFILKEHLKKDTVASFFVEHEYNYCYHGKDPAFEIIKGTITALEIGLPLLGLFCGPAAPACIAGLGFVTGLSGETTKAMMETQHQWPNHR